MESPVVVDKPPEYHGGERGFPFDDEDEGAWSESFSSRHPDLAARLRRTERPANWTRKRRPSSQDADDFGDSFGAFDRFPFNEIPPQFRDHFPDLNRRFGSRDEPQPQPQPQASQSPPQHQTAATQTEHNLPEDSVPTNLPQYGLRNTVDLGQKSAADPSLVDAEDRNQRSMSAPPDSRTNANMSGQGHPEQHRVERQIPIFVEGRDEPVINTFVDNSTHFADNKPTYPTNIDRDQYFTNDGPTGIHHPPNMQKSFGTFNKAYKQPFSQQKMYPQSAAGAPNRGASPQRTQSPHRPADAGAPHSEQQPADKRPQPADKRPPQPHQQPSHPPPSSQSPPPPQNAAPPKPQPAANDPITQILAIQTDVLNLMTDVEKFTGNKKDKNYLYLDEMLTRNLIKLDLIETDGKENIRTARKEAIRCIQKCIAVLEAKAEKASQEAAASEAAGEKPNGEVDMKDVSEEPKAETTEPPPQAGNAGAPAQPAAETVAAPAPQETRTVETEPKVHGSRNKTTEKREKSKENTDQMQVEEPLEQPAVPMEQDVPSQ